MMRWLGALAVFLAAPAVAQTKCGDLPKTFEGKAYAQSGDTLAASGMKQPLGLWGLKTPNPQTSVAGIRSRAALEDILASAEHRVSCHVVRWDQVCRALAQCTISAAWPAGSAPQSHDIGVRMIEDGWAYGSDLNLPPDADKDAGEKIAHFEALARQARKGLWAEWLGEPSK